MPPQSLAVLKVIIKKIAQEVHCPHYKTVSVNYFINTQSLGSFYYKLLRLICSRFNTHDIIVQRNNTSCRYLFNVIFLYL